VRYHIKEGRREGGRWIIESEEDSVRMER